MYFIFKKSRACSANFFKSWGACFTLGEGVAQAVTLPSYMGERLANRHSGWKSLIYSFSCSIYGIWGKGLAENVRIPSYDRGGLKLL